MVFIHRHSSNLRLNLSICRPYSAVLSTEILCAAPSELGISRYLACAVGIPQGLTRTWLDLNVFFHHQITLQIKHPFTKYSHGVQIAQLDLKCP